MIAEKSGEESESFAPEKPWPCPERGDCQFYHSLDFPDDTSIEGFWDIRGRFDEYVGRYPLAGKSVLDIGTATGFLAFSAEAAGAQVTALDARGQKNFSASLFATHSIIETGRRGLKSSTRPLTDRCETASGTHGTSLRAR